MPRKARIDMSGALHHLMIRGIERKRIFRNDQDRDNFLDRLGLLLVESKTECILFLLLGGERAWDAGNGSSAAAEINPAGSVYFSEGRAAHRQRKKT